MELRDNDHLDHWLNSALQQYGSAEPRAGLEGRVLANLATEKQPLTLRWRWGIAVAGALVICSVLGLWLEGFLPIPHTHRTVAVQAPIRQSNASHLGPQTPEHPAVKLRIQSVTAKQRRVPKIKTVDLPSEPRLERFPSLRPLSEQEKLLQEFIRNAPQQAVLVAQAQAERQKQLDRLMAGQSSNGESEEQER
jgi:hypothetical protein